MLMEGFCVVPPGPQAAHGPMHQLPGGRAGRGGPGPGRRPHLLRLCQGGAAGSGAEGSGDARSRSVMGF